MSMNTIPREPTMAMARRLEKKIRAHLSVLDYPTAYGELFAWCWGWDGLFYEWEPVVYPVVRREDQAAAYLVRPTVWALSFGSFPKAGWKLGPMRGGCVFDCVNPFHMRLVRRG